jgi:hypothetical protein
MAEHRCGHQVPHRNVQGRNGPGHIMCPRDKCGNAGVPGQRWTSWPAAIRPEAAAIQRTRDLEIIRHAEITGWQEADATGPADRREPA